jgi:hypothetical protein
MYPCNRPRKPIYLWNIEPPTFPRKSAHRWWWGFWALRVFRPLPPGRFIVLISVRGWVDLRVIVRLEGLGKLRKVHLIRIRSHELPACSIVLQPTTLPRAPFLSDIFQYCQNLQVFKTRKTTIKILCKIWGSHGGHYEECRLLGCGAVYFLCEGGM